MIKKAFAVILLSFSAYLPASEDGPAVVYDGKEYRLQDLPPALQEAYTHAREKASETLSPDQSQELFEKYINKIADASHRTIDDVRDELLKATPAVKEKAVGYYQQLKDKASDLKEQAEDTQTGQTALSWIEKAREKAKSLIEASN